MDAVGPVEVDDEVPAGEEVLGEEAPQRHVLHAPLFVLGAHEVPHVPVQDELVERLLARGRADDTEETVRARFQIYLDQTQPLIDLYDQRGLTVHVNGVGDVDEVTERVLATLE